MHRPWLQLVWASNSIHESAERRLASAAGAEACVHVCLLLLLRLLLQEAYLRRLSKLPVEEEDDGLL